MAKEWMIPKGQTKPAITIYQYWEDSEKITEKKTTFDYKFKNVYQNGKGTQEARQDSLFGEMEVYAYDLDGNLIKETIYRDLRDTTDFYGNTYGYSKGMLVGQQSFNNSSSVIRMNRDKVTFEYDEKGLLIAENRFYKGELKFSYRYEYQ